MGSSRAASVMSRGGLATPYDGADDANSQVPFPSRLLEPPGCAFDKLDGRRSSGTPYGRTPLASPLASMDGALPLHAGAFTRNNNRAGVVWNQKSAYGQSAGMGMVMHPPKPHRRELRGPRT